MDTLGFSCRDSEALKVFGFFMWLNPAEVQSIFAMFFIMQLIFIIHETVLRPTCDLQIGTFYHSFTKFFDRKMIKNLVGGMVKCPARFKYANFRTGLKRLKPRTHSPRNWSNNNNQKYPKYKLTKSWKCIFSLNQK